MTVVSSPTMDGAKEILDVIAVLQKLPHAAEVIGSAA